MSARWPYWARSTSEPVSAARRAVLVAAALVLLGLAATSPVARAETLYLQPMGKALPEADVALVEQALRQFYGLDVQRLPRVPLPKAAWTAPRRRWRAERLLDFLLTRLPPGGTRILGLTADDISTTKGKVADWGVLGLATLDGHTGVISSFRARRGVGPAKARIRLAKVAVHEIGHSLGLEHCPTRGCLMEDAQGKVATCDREADLCGRCRAELKARGQRLPAITQLPWPVP